MVLSKDEHTAYLTYGGLQLFSLTSVSAATKEGKYTLRNVNGNVDSNRISFCIRVFIWGGIKRQWAVFIHRGLVRNGRSNI